MHFLETLHALAGRVAGTDLPSDEEFFLHDRLIQRLPKVSRIVHAPAPQAGRRAASANHHILSTSHFIQCVFNMFRTG